MSSSSSSQSSRSSSKTRQETPKSTSSNTAAKSDRPKPVVSNSLADEIAKQVQVILQRSKEVTEKQHQQQETEKYSPRVLMIYI